MEALLSFLNGLVEGALKVVIKLLGNVIEWIIAPVKSMWIMLSLAWGLVWGLYQYVMTSTDLMMDYIALIAFEQYGSAVFDVNDWVRWANTILPLYELLYFSGVYLSVCAAMYVIRLIKSFIPTIA